MTIIDLYAGEEIGVWHDSEDEWFSIHYMTTTIGIEKKHLPELIKALKTAQKRLRSDKK